MEGGAGNDSSWIFTMNCGWEREWRARLSWGNRGSEEPMIMGSVGLKKKALQLPARRRPDGCDGGVESWPRRIAFIRI
jgi:hypothetical protein